MNHNTLQVMLESESALDAFFSFIDEHESEDITRLRLRYSSPNTEKNKGRESLIVSGQKAQSFDPGFAIDQIECRRRTRQKLPRFVANPRTLFPAVVSSEQASDEGIALFHASLLAEDERVADLTAGLGIDAMTLSDECREVTAVELDPLRADVLAHNVRIRGIRNLKTINADCMEWIKDKEGFDTLFIDPARRGDNNSRKYAFADCAPDITRNLDLLLSKCDRLLVKASPLLDLTAIKKELRGVTRIWVLSRKGECKEILIEIRTGGELQELLAGDVDDDGKARLFSVSSERIRNEVTEWVEEEPKEGNWLYEPSAALMKLGAWGEVGRRWPTLRKMAPNSHLFISEERVENFPGREFKVRGIMDKRGMKGLKGVKANVMTRNHPLTAEQLKRKIGVTDGGDSYIIGTRWGKKGKPVILRCERNI